MCNICRYVCMHVCTCKYHSLSLSLALCLMYVRYITYAVSAGIYACMHVCVCKCVYVCVRVCMYVGCVYARVCARLRINRCNYTYIYIHVCTTLVSLLRNYLSLSFSVYQGIWLSIHPPTHLFIRHNFIKLRDRGEVVLFIIFSWQTQGDTLNSE